MIIAAVTLAPTLIKKSFNPFSAAFTMLVFLLDLIELSISSKISNASFLSLSLIFSLSKDFLISSTVWAISELTKLFEL